VCADAALGQTVVVRGALWSEEETVCLVEIIGQLRPYGSLWFSSYDRSANQRKLGRKVGLPRTISAAAFPNPIDWATNARKGRPAWRASGRPSIPSLCVSARCVLVEPAGVVRDTDPYASNAAQAAQQCWSGRFARPPRTARVRGTQLSCSEGFLHGGR